MLELLSGPRSYSVSDGRTFTVHPSGNYGVTYPASSGSRGYSNVFGTFLVPSSQTVIPIGTVAAHYCDECDDYTTPESHARIVHDNRPPYYRAATIWVLYPCHETVCEGYRCTNVDVHCELCARCDSCCECVYCYRCDDKVSPDDYCGNCGFCDECCECVTCDDCGNRVAGESTIIVGGNTEVCGRCLDYSYGYCEDCDEYYHHDFSSDHDHSNGCECEARYPEFVFRNGLAQNTRSLIEIPSGEISKEGLRAIAEVISAANLPRKVKRWVYPLEGEAHEIEFEMTLDPWDVRYTVNAVDPVWQTKEGNFTKRLARTFYRDLKCKIPADVLSEVGNLCNQHTVKTREFRIELTRDLNGTARDFYHSDSCWWQSYAESRCALKNWGGLGIRSYAADDTDSHFPNGRAWIQPLNSDLTPTPDIANARGFLVYNGYGALEGFAAARIVAAMCGMTYSKVGISLDPQYVNGNGGFLVSDSETCEKTTSVHFDASAHSLTD